MTTTQKKYVQTSLLGFYKKDGKVRPIIAPKGVHRGGNAVRPKKLKIPKNMPKIWSSKSKKCRHGKCLDALLVSIPIVRD